MPEAVCFLWHVMGHVFVCLFLSCLRARSHSCSDFRSAAPYYVHGCKRCLLGAQRGSSAVCSKSVSAGENTGARARKGCTSPPGPTGAKATKEAEAGRPQLPGRAAEPFWTRTKSPGLAPGKNAYAREQQNTGGHARVVVRV